MGFRETAAGAVVACAILFAGPVAAAGAEEEEPICVGDSCQPLPPEPEDPTPGTLVPTGGNPPLHVYEPHKKKKKKKNKGRQRAGHHGKHGKGGRSGR